MIIDKIILTSEEEILKAKINNLVIRETLHRFYIEELFLDKSDRNNKLDQIANELNLNDFFSKAMDELENYKSIRIDGEIVGRLHFIINDDIELSFCLTENNSILISGNYLKTYVSEGTPEHTTMEIEWIEKPEEVHYKSKIIETYPEIGIVKTTRCYIRKIGRCMLIPIIEKIKSVPILERK